MTLTGLRLTDVNTIEFDAAGVVATDIVPNGAGTQVTATLTVAADAVLTGDAATNLRVTTGHGNSPKVSIVITP